MKLYEIIFQQMTGKSALHIACLNGYWDIVKLMVEKDKSVINDAPIVSFYAPPRGIIFFRLYIFSSNCPNSG